MAALGKDDTVKALMEGRKKAGENQYVALALATSFSVDIKIPGKYPTFTALGKAIDDSKDISAAKQIEFLQALGAKSVTDEDLLFKIDLDLTKNPKLIKQIVNALEQPDSAPMLNAIKNYQGGNMATLLPPLPATPDELEAEKQRKAKAEAAQKAKEEEKAAKEAKAETARLASVAAINRAKATSADITGNNKGKGTTAAPAAPQPAEAPAAPVAAAAPATATDAPTSGNATASSGSGKSSSIEDDLIDALANASDADIKKMITPTLTKQIASGLADKAASVGVEGSTISGFRNTINGNSIKNGKIVQDDKLATDIANNFKNNPEFVRSLARLAKDKSNVAGPLKSMAMQEMNHLMSNPQNLANDKEVKLLQSKLAKLEEAKKTGLASMMGGVIEKLMAGGAQAQDTLAGFKGPHQVVSVCADPRGSMIPNICLNLDSWGRNVEEHRAASNYSPLDMRALSNKGENGTFFREVIKTDAQGNKTKESVPYSQITVKNALGQDVNVIPSVGVLMAKQMAGQFNEQGKFIPGNIRVPVVTALNEVGDASKIATIVMTPAQFVEYKKIAEAAAKNSTSERKELAFQEYTEQDARDAGKGPSIRVTSVHPATGATSPVVTLDIPRGQPPAPQADTGPGVTHYGLAKDGSVLDKRELANV